MQEWMKGWFKSSNDKGTTYFRNRGTIVIVFVSALIVLSVERLTPASFFGRLACLVIVVAAYWGVGKLIEAHNNRHPESTSFAVRKMRL